MIISIYAIRYSSQKDKKKEDGWLNEQNIFYIYALIHKETVKITRKARADMAEWMVKKELSLTHNVYKKGIS